MLENTGCAHKNQDLTSKKTRKNHKKIDSQTYSKKTPLKTSQKSIFTPIWASQNLTQIDKNRKKIESAIETPRPHRTLSSPQRDPPWKSSPRDLLKVIHSLKYLISTQSMHPSIHTSIHASIHPSIHPSDRFVSSTVGAPCNEVT